MAHEETTTLHQRLTWIPWLCIGAVVALGACGSSALMLQTHHGEVRARELGEGAVTEGGKVSFSVELAEGSCNLFALADELSLEGGPDGIDAATVRVDAPDGVASSLQLRPAEEGRPWLVSPEYCAVVSGHHTVTLTSSVGEGAFRAWVAEVPERDFEVAQRTAGER